MIYFVHAVGTQFVKIGLTENLEARLCDLKVSSPHELKVLAVLDGGREEEAQWHAEFSAHWVRGEWFAIAPVCGEPEASSHSALVNVLLKKLEVMTQERNQLDAYLRFVNLWIQHVMTARQLKALAEKLAADIKAGAGSWVVVNQMLVEALSPALRPPVMAKTNGTEARIN